MKLGVKVLISELTLRGKTIWLDLTKSYSNSTPQLLILKYFKSIEKFKELYNEHTFTFPLDS